jgi:hypothetical protein
MSPWDGGVLYNI